MNPPDFSKLRSGSLDILSIVFLCLGCLGLPSHPTPPEHDSVQLAAIDQGRIANWASQLPIGEAKREGIIGSAIV
jgi:hypothetical protein